MATVYVNNMPIMAGILIQRLGRSDSAGVQKGWRSSFTGETISGKGRRNESQYSFGYDCGPGDIAESGTKGKGYNRTQGKHG